MKIIPINLTFDTNIQSEIFFSCLNSNKGLSIKELITKIGYPKTTIIDNCKKLRKRELLEPHKYLYVKKRNNGKRGRPKTIFFVPNFLYDTLKVNLFTITILNP